MVTSTQGMDLLGFGWDLCIKEETEPKNKIIHKIDGIGECYCIQLVNKFLDTGFTVNVSFETVRKTKIFKIYASKEVEKEGEDNE